MTLPLTVDPARLDQWNEVTGIYVRACHPGTGKFGDYDIATLDTESLKRWLQSGPRVAVNTILVIFQHTRS